MKGSWILCIHELLIYYVLRFITQPVFTCRSIRPELFCRKDVLRNFAKFTRKHLCLWPEACNFIKKRTLAQVSSYKFCEISKNTFFYRTAPVAASVLVQSQLGKHQSNVWNVFKVKNKQKQPFFNTVAGLRSVFL